jgi:hypothetical protein
MPAVAPNRCAECPSLRRQTLQNSKLCHNHGTHIIGRAVVRSLDEKRRTQSEKSLFGPGADTLMLLRMDRILTNEIIEMTA